MKTYDLHQVENYFQEWSSPQELAGMLRRVAMNMSIACLQAETAQSELREDLEDLKNFIVCVEKVKPFP